MVALVQEPSGRSAPVRLVCRDGAAVVSCSHGPVTVVTVGPGTTWVPGQTYRLVVTRPGAAPVTSTFVAPRVIPAGSAAIGYRWASVRSRGAFGGSVLKASTRGATETIAFSGPSITWYGPVGPELGVVDVLVDGRIRAMVNARATRARTRVAHALTRLGAGRHTLTLRVRRGTIEIDAVRVGHGKVLATPAFSATWVTGTAGATASLRFFGTGVRWASTGSAKVAVFVDGRRHATGPIGGLSHGMHVLRLVILRGSLRLQGFHVT